MNSLEILKELESKLNISTMKKYSNSGQKSVFLVKCNMTGKKKILKIIFQHNVERVLREIKIQKEYKFNYTPKILYYDNYNNDVLYIIEEYISGKDLRQIIKDEPNFTAENVIEFAESILNILEEFEVENLVHRDLKPENIIRNEHGWYVIDFGIAKANEFNTLTMIDTGNMGPHTPGYGAPELFRYDSSIIDIRADIFSLGILMYELSVGYNPFISNPASDPNFEILYIKPDLAEIKGDLECKPLAKIINIFMNTDISKRPRDVATARSWLEKTKNKL